MKIILIQVIAILCASGVYATEPAPPPCGRAFPPGFCATKAQCEHKDGFFVARDCEIYAGVGGYGGPSSINTSDFY